MSLLILMSKRKCPSDNESISSDSSKTSKKSKTGSNFAPYGTKMLAAKNPLMRITRYSKN